MGQVREKNAGISPMLHALNSLGRYDEGAKNMCLAIPEVDPELIRSFVQVTTICGKYLTMSNAFVGDKLTLGQNIMRYLSENYSSHIQISDICKALGYSKSTILSAFKKEYGTTINAHLNSQRLKTAKKLLDEGELSINEIAHATGFADQSYFSKVFSAKFGIPPSEYRKDDIN
jgi:AraC-like DNA-binding protein